MKSCEASNSEAQATKELVFIAAGLLGWPFELGTSPKYLQRFNLQTLQLHKITSDLQIWKTSAKLKQVFASDSHCLCSNALTTPTPKSRIGCIFWFPPDVGSSLGILRGSVCAHMNQIDSNWFILYLKGSPAKTSKYVQNSIKCKKMQTASSLKQYVQYILSIQFYTYIHTIHLFFKTILSWWRPTLGRNTVCLSACDQNAVHLLHIASTTTKTMEQM